MKKLLVTFLTISMITATGNTHAMFKNILNSLYKPQLSFEQKQALVKQQFPMPPFPSHQMHKYDNLAYTNLSKDLIIKKDEVNQDRKYHNKYRMFAPALAAAVLMFPWWLLWVPFDAWSLGNRIAKDCYKKSTKEYKNIEQEMKDFLNTQKRELRLHDDIQ